MDSVSLRKTHFKLGDYRNPYTTTVMDQNRNIENKRPFSVATLDPNVKNDLRKSHFILGNQEPTYTTVNQSEFNNKQGNINPMQEDANAKKIEKALRSHNYVLGNDKPNYKSETQSRYINPLQQGNNRVMTAQPTKKISTHELQKSHYVFGNHNDPWLTTQQMCFAPKDLEVKKFSKDLTKTNFKFGEDKPDLRSVNQDTYIPHKISKNCENKELSKDLRSKKYF